MYFAVTLGFVLVQSMAFGLFLAEYGSRGLPYSYISIAVFASLLAAAYIRLGGQVSFAKLLTINLGFLGSVSLLIWLALNSPIHRAVIFILPLWFQIVVNFGILAVWSLAGSLFDMRQAKRLFPLLASGRWVASIATGLFIPVLVKTIGAVHLLVPAALSFAAAILLLRVITRAYIKPQPAAAAAPRPTPRGRADGGSSGLLKDRYVLLIFGYTVIWWVAFNFVDNIFFDRAFAQYPDANQMTAAMGRLVSLIGIVALIASTFINGRLISRFGLRAGLLGMPAALILIVGLLGISGSLGASLSTVFTLAALAWLIEIAFGFSLSLSANAIVYQSLPDTLRPRVQATAEAVVQPLAVGLAGITLLALTSGLNFTYAGLAYVYVGLGAVWVFFILLLSRNYVGALTRVITKRRLGDDALVLADPASTALLQGQLHGKYAGSVIYALERLEMLDEGLAAAQLPGLLRHEAPEVRREAFTRIERMKLTGALSAVREQYRLESVPAVKEAALRALGAMGDGSTELAQALDASDPRLLRAALTGLLKYRGDPSAARKLEDLLASASKDDRSLAIEVLADVDFPGRAAQLLRLCDAPESSRLAGRALAAAGMQALPEIEAAFCDPGAPPQRLSALTDALGRIGGEEAQRILTSRLSTSDAGLRAQILGALDRTGYRTKDAALIERLVRAEAAEAARLSAAQADLAEAAADGMLEGALRQSLAQTRSRILLLLSFFLDSGSIRKAREALNAGAGSRTSYALEILDAQLPAAWKSLVMPVLEDLPPEERSRRLSIQFPQAKRTAAERLDEIAGDASLPYWLRACAAHSATSGDDAMLSTVEKVLILKSVGIFSQTPDNVLADVAGLLEQVDLPAGETVFHQGQPGDSMYIILDGRVRVHDGERVINYLGEREIFGEMALLDPEPRSASVTAEDATRLFRLDQEPFYALMEERPEVAVGIIHVLSGHLRNRVRDLAELSTKIRELEGR